MNQDLTMLSLLKEELEREVKETLYGEMLQEFLKEVEKQFAEVVRPKIAKISFDKMECFKNIADMRNEIRLSINGVEEPRVSNET
jgi:polyphosphate kinase